MLRSVITPYLDTRRGHHPAAPHACELPSRQRLRRLRRPSPHRPRTRFLPQATRPHSPNPHLGCWTIPANLPIARPPARPVPPVRMAQYPRFGFPPGCLLTAGLRFHLRLSRSCLLLRQLLLGAYRLLSELLLIRLLHRSHL